MGGNIHILPKYEEIVYYLSYYRWKWVYYFSSLPGAKVANEFSAAGAKLLLWAHSEEKKIIDEYLRLFPIYINKH